MEKVNSQMTMKVRLVPGKRVWNPATRLILPEGAVVSVPQESYWLRRVQDGSIERMGDDAQTKGQFEAAPPKDAPITARTVREAAEKAAAPKAAPKEGK